MFGVWIFEPDITALGCIRHHMGVQQDCRVNGGYFVQYDSPRLLSEHGAAHGKLRAKKKPFVIQEVIVVNILGTDQ